MKSLFKKPWFIGTLIIGLILVVFLINLGIMSLNLKSPHDEDNFWFLASNISDGRYLNIFAFILKILFYVSIIPILLAGFSFYKKNNWGILSAVLYFLGFGTTLIVFQSLNNYLTIFSMILVILTIVLVVGIFVLSILRRKTLDLTKDSQKDEKNIKLSETKIPVFVLIVDIFSIVVFLTTFIIPLYTLVESGNNVHAIFIHALFVENANVDIIIYFLVNFAIFLGIFLYFANCLSNYYFDKERFINKSKTLVTYTFVATLLFFIGGLVMDITYTLGGSTAQTVAYIPMLLMFLVIFGFAILKGKFSSFQQISYGGRKIRFAKSEPLFYVLLLTTVTVLMLLLPIIKIEVAFGSYSYPVNLTGIAILRDYASLDPGYRLVAYALVVMLISVGLSLVMALASYLSKAKQFSSIVKFATITNIFFVFIIAVSGYYFQIAKEINQVVMLDIFSFYGINLPDIAEFEYTVSTDAIYALMASLAVLILMFARRAFDRDEMNLLEAGILPIEGASGSNGELSGDTSDDTYQPNDPCYAFTELDSKIESFKEDLEKREILKPEEPTLNELVNFVVDYARNSRLHLSYTPEDIATFVAGLGAAKLSILQGMSGTGKTSLPKIFSEAVFGNCDIIEVESSWKDKNELLGYYNEFSLKYTPKKFTLALYKAALNQEIFTFILLDEMNLSRIEYYFSDFLSLMENEEGHREIKLINIKLVKKEEDDDEVEYIALNEGHTLKVPANVWFIGTANRDESTFVISDKVYDRAHTMNFTKRAPKVRNYSNPIPKQYYNYQIMNELFNAAKAKGDFDAENSELIKSVEALLAPFNISFGNRILKQIEDFVNIYKECFVNEDVESEAIEKILLSKVVAKLEVKTIDDKEKLEMEFEKLNLHQCAEFIKRLDNE